MGFEGFGTPVGALRDSDVPSAAAIRFNGQTYVAKMFTASPQAVAQAVEWRFMVRALYLAAASPPVPGFTDSQVDQVLWGELPPDPEFFAALLRVLSAPARSRAAIPVGEQDEKVNTVVEANLDLTSIGEALQVFGSAVDGVASLTRRARPGRPDYKGLGRLIPMDSAPRGFAPPDPEGFDTVAEFLQGLQDLRVWAKMSLRDIEERTEKLAEAGEPVMYLRRATISDLLRREKLPKRDAVRAYVVACGLTPAMQGRWLGAYDRLRFLKTATAGRTLMPTEGSANLQAA